MEVKNIFEMNQEELREYNEKKLNEFKEYFLNTDLPIDEIFDKIGVSKGDVTFRYINGNRKKHRLSAKNRNVNFTVVEQSSSDINKEFEDFYQKFKEIWIENPTISKSKAFKQLGETYKTNALGKYVNNRLDDDNLPINHVDTPFEKKSKKKKWGRTVKNVKNTLNTDKTPEEAYAEYKDLFLNSKLSIAEIYETIGVPQNQNTHYVYIRQQAEKDGLNGYSRRLQLKHGGRPKGSKNLKSLTGTEKEQHEEYFEKCYQQFLEYYQDINLSVQDILKKMGTHHKSNMYYYFRQRMREDGLDPIKRQGECIGRKIKKTYEQRRKSNEPFYEERYAKYKKLFHESELTMAEIYTELDVEPRSVCAKYIRKRAQEEGLNSRKRRFELFPTNEISEEEYKRLDSLYEEYKKLFLETDTPVMKIYEKLGIGYGSKRGRYIRDKAHQDGLDGNRRYLSKNNEAIRDFEKLFEEYKKLFFNTELKISEIYEQLHVNPNTYEHNYIRKRASKEGLNGRKRMYKIKQKKIGPGRKKYKSRKNSSKKRKTKYSMKTVKQVNSSSETLNRFFKQRNVKKSTKQGYIASIHHWFNFVGDKYNNLQENIDFYIREEDERIPMRERTIKKDLLGFREYLINCETMNTKKSIMSYYSKITAIFRHCALEIPTLPIVKIEKGYVSNYNDLPTHEMIKTACDQSPVVLKSVFLFMSSSGSAKAETLSITVGMFLKGCSEYLDEMPNESNIKVIIKNLKGRHDIIPLIYLRRIKTDKWYYTCCSPEASYMIIEYLSQCNNLKWDDKLFPFSSSNLLEKFQKINDKNNWGKVGKYRRFRAHALRKFMASNIGLPRDQVDSFQGRSKDMIAEAYFKQDPKQLKKIYLGAMHRVMIYDNWGHDIESTEVESSTEPVIENDNPEVKVQPVNESADNKSSIADELLKYSQLQKEGFITMDEFNAIKIQLIGGIL